MNLKKNHKSVKIFEIWNTNNVEQAQAQKLYPWYSEPFPTVKDEGVK